jgi:hypothetical protein
MHVAVTTFELQSAFLGSKPVRRATPWTRVLGARACTNPSALPQRYCQKTLSSLYILPTFVLYTRSHQSSCTRSSSQALHFQALLAASINTNDPLCCVCQARTSIARYPYSLPKNGRVNTGTAGATPHQLVGYYC